MEPASAFSAVLIVCKVIIGPGDMNTEFTGYHQITPKIENGTQVCQRVRVELDQVCRPKSLLMSEFQWNLQNEARPWRVFRSACATPRITAGGKPAWTLPSCREIMGTSVECRNDILI